MSALYALNFRPPPDDDFESALVRSIHARASKRIHTVDRLDFSAPMEEPNVFFWKRPPKSQGEIDEAKALAKRFPNAAAVFLVDYVSPLGFSRLLLLGFKNTAIINPELGDLEGALASLWMALDNLDEALTLNSCGPKGDLACLDTKMTAYMASVFGNIRDSRFQDITATPKGPLYYLRSRLGRALGLDTSSREAIANSLGSKHYLASKLNQAVASAVMAQPEKNGSGLRPFSALDQPPPQPSALNPH